MFNYTDCHDNVHVYYATIVTGFCDADSTSNQTYGNYTWLEAAGGQTISLNCHNLIDSMNSTLYARRICLGFEQGWNTLIDFTDCRNGMITLYLYENVYKKHIYFTVTSGIVFEFYLRFSSSFDSSLQSEIIIDNIRITVRVT